MKYSNGRQATDGDYVLGKTCYGWAVFGCIFNVKGAWLVHMGSYSVNGKYVVACPECMYFEDLPIDVQKQLLMNGVGPLPDDFDIEQIFPKEPTP